MPGAHDCARRRDRRTTVAIAAANKRAHLTPTTPDACAAATCACPPPPSVTLCAEVERGSLAVRSCTVANGERMQMYSFRITICNCDSRALPSTRVRLNLRHAFASHGTFCSPNAQTTRICVYSSIGNVNPAYNGVDDVDLLRPSFAMPAGCASLLVTVSDYQFTPDTEVSAVASVTAARTAQYVSVSANVATACAIAAASFANETAPSSQQPLIYVVPAPPGSPEPTMLVGNGRSWTTAYVGERGLRAAFEQANATDAHQHVTIWVADGTYTMAQPIAVAHGNVSAYAGFARGATAMCSRASLVRGGGSGTVIVPSLTFAPSSTPSALVVVSGADDDAERTVLLDGFTFRLNVGAATVERAVLFDGPFANVLLRNVYVASFTGSAVTNTAACGCVCVYASTFHPDDATDPRVFEQTSQSTVACFAYYLKNVDVCC